MQSRLWNIFGLMWWKTSLSDLCCFVHARSYCSQTKKCEQSVCEPDRRLSETESSTTSWLGDIGWTPSDWKITLLDSSHITTSANRDNTLCSVAKTTFYRKQNMFLEWLQNDIISGTSMSQSQNDDRTVNITISISIGPRNTYSVLCDDFEIEFIGNKTCFWNGCKMISSPVNRWVNQTSYAAQVYQDELLTKKLVGSECWQVWAVVILQTTESQTWTNTTSVQLSLWLQLIRISLSRIHHAIATHYQREEREYYFGCTCIGT